MQADGPPGFAELAPCAPQADALDGRAGGASRVLALPIERLEGGQAQVPGSKPAVFARSREHWRRPGAVVDSEESPTDDEARART